MSSTVCILDDDEAVRDSMRTLLESYALDAREFGSCRDVLASPELGRFGCFVVDFHMPEMNGLELLEALRGRGVSAPALIISALSVGGPPDRMANAGVVAVLTKPVAEGELVGWIRHALDGAAAPS